MPTMTTADQQLLTAQYNAWLNSPAGVAAFNGQASARTSNPTAANAAMVAAFRTWATTPQTGTVTPPNVAPSADLIRLMGEAPKAAEVTAQLNTMSATAPTAAPAGPAAAPPATGAYRFGTVEEARAWVGQQIANTQGNAREAWMRVSENVGALYTAGANNVGLLIRDGRLDTAGMGNWINGQVENIKNAFTSLGAGAPGEEPGFFGGILNFLKNNMFTLGAGAVAAFAGNALGLGTIGTILLGLVGAGLGGALGDGASGFVGRLLGMNPTPVAPGGPGYVPPSVVVTTGMPTPQMNLTNTNTINPTLAQPTGFGEVALAPVTPIPGQVIKPANTTTLSVTQDGRTITYFGRVEGTTFITDQMRITDAGNPANGTQLFDLNSAALRIPVTAGTTPGTFRANLDAATSNNLVATANNTLNVATGRMGAPAPGGTAPTQLETYTEATELYTMGSNAGTRATLAPNTSYVINVRGNDEDNNPLMGQLIGRTDASGNFLVSGMNLSNGNGVTSPTQTFNPPRSIAATGGTFNAVDTLNGMKPEYLRWVASANPNRPVPFNLTGSRGTGTSANNFTFEGTAGTVSNSPMRVTGTLNGTTLTIAENSVTVDGRTITSPAITVDVTGVDLTNATGMAEVTRRVGAGLSGNATFMQNIRAPQATGNTVVYNEGHGLGNVGVSSGPSALQV
jgi:hypothetical protein